METVSVIMPCFNSGDFILESVDSALNQTGSFILKEVLVIDDNSTDRRTLDVLNSLRQHPKVIILKNSRSKGSAGARNSGILHSASEWIAFLDSDDLMLEGAIETRLKEARKYPGVSWIGADFSLCDQNLQVLKESFFRRSERASGILYSCHGDSVLFARPFSIFVDTNLTHTCATMVRREALIRVGMFDERFLKAQDYHLFLKLANSEDFLFVRAPVFRYRCHSGGVTATGAPREWATRVFQQILKEPWADCANENITRRIAQFMMEDIYYYYQLNKTSEVVRLWRHSLHNKTNFKIFFTGIMLVSKMIAKKLLCFNQKKSLCH